MKRICDTWVPDEDEHLEAHLPECAKFAGLPLYQPHHIFAVLSQCRKFRTAVDVGAHVGLWSRFLANIFQRVVAYEPSPAHAACWVENVQQPNAELRIKACGAENEVVRFHENQALSMKSHINPRGALQVEMVRLDGEGLTQVDLIKFDCEGYDTQAVIGAEKTIRNNRPAIIVEQVRGVSEVRYGIKDLLAVSLLQKMGYTIRLHVGGDYVMAFGGKR